MTRVTHRSFTNFKNKNARFNDIRQDCTLLYTHPIRTSAHMMPNFMSQHNMLSVEWASDKVFVRMVLPALQKMVLKSLGPYSMRLVIGTHH